MKKLKPQQFLDLEYPDIGYTTKTVINWIKSGKITGIKTPSGRWLVLVEEQQESKICSLVQLMEAAAK
jgi:predicted site-specific integrase-resolvase